MKKLALLAGIILALTVSTVASAVEYGGIGGQPANPRPDNPRTSSIFIHSLKATESVTDGVKLYNNTAEPRTVAVHAVDAVIANDGAFACAQQVEAKRDVGSWTKLASSSVTIPANDTVVVPFTVTVPAKANVGEHNGCITIQDTAASQQASGTSGVTIGFRSAIRLVITVPGQIVKDLDFDDLSTQGPVNNKYILHPRATNGGNVSLDTSLAVRIRSLFGQIASSSEATYPILPGSTASWNFELDRPFWGGLYWAEVEATYDGSVSSELGESGDTNKTVSERSKLFFAAPEPLAILIQLGALLLLGGGLLFIIMKRRKTRHIRKLHRKK